jgi:hypothetical protein
VASEALSARISAQTPRIEPAPTPATLDGQSPPASARGRIASDA